MAIPVPAGTDPACDFSEDWCETAAAINAKIAAYQTALARAYPASPQALLRRTESLTALTVLAPVPMTEATFDTAGMTDLDADPTIITIQQTGRYMIRGWLLAATTGVLNTLVTATLNISGPVSGSVIGYALDRVQIGVGSFHPTPFSDGTEFIKGTKISLSTSIPITATTPLIRASLFVGWHADQENP